MKAWSTQCLTLVTQSPTPLEVKLTLHGPRPRLSHIASINCPVWLKVPGKQCFYQAGYSMGLENISQELAESQIFLWNVQGLNVCPLL